ncbi:RacP protein [Streptomyces fractus]|uniref:RacP protein n=1 Tax=Streptomyces fractus TaxID=641806 RepID=UPI003CF72084
MSGRSPTAERHAELIRTALYKAAPAGLAIAVLMTECNLSIWQTRRALAALRDLCAEKGWPPVIWTRGIGYQFAAGEGELERWERAWISERLTQFRRMLSGTLGPHLRLFPKSDWAEYLTAQVKAIESNLEIAAGSWPR